MADITHLFLRRHLRSGPTAWTRHSVGLRLRREGVGLSYAFRARTAVISEVPVEDRELSLVAHARSADQAEVSVPLGVTWRVVEPGLAARRIDFGIDTRTGRWLSTPLDALATLLGELAQEPVVALLAGTARETALTGGPEPVRGAVAARLAGDERLAELGVAVVGVRVLAVWPRRRSRPHERAASGGWHSPSGPVSLEPRVVVVTRPSAYRELLHRHGTPGAVRFFLRDRDADELADLRARDDAWRRALDAAVTAVPAGWRLGRADRADLPAFGFAPGDVVVAVGPDGLVANVAKYLDDQPVVGVDPAGPGVLARHRVNDLPALLARLDSAVVEERATVAAELDDGQRLRGLNEIFVGDRGHQSARYRLRLPDGRGEPQSSSGVIVATGTGATGWCAPLARTTAHPPPPHPVEPALAWFVREAWPGSGTDFTVGRLDGDERLELTVTSDALVVFSDGGETDRRTAVRGQRVTIGLSSRRLRLVVPGGAPHPSSACRNRASSPVSAVRSDASRWASNA